MLYAKGERAVQTVLNDDEVLGADGLPYCKRCGGARGEWYDGRLFRYKCNCQSLECERREREERNRLRKDELRKASNIATGYEKCRFADKHITKENAEKVERCKRYCAVAEEMLKGGFGVYIYGAPGTGKTFLAACMANELIDGLHSVFMTGFAEIEREMKTAFGKAEQREFVERALRADFLFLDDLGTEELKKEENSWAQAMVYDVINRRYASKKPVICTGNYSFAEMAEKQIYPDRTTGRLSELCSLVIELNGVDERKLASKRRRGKMKECLDGVAGWSSSF
jgi:DNA replication protein DnaC